MNSLVSPADHWTIWAFLVGWAAASLWLEQRFLVVKKVTGAVVALTGGMVVSNTGLFPTESPSYDVVWDYVVPLAIPLLLMRMDLRRVFRETGRLMGAFHISSLGTVVGSVIAVALLHDRVEHLELIGPAMTGSYIGGGVNFLALVATFEPPKILTNATIVADSAVMVVYFLVLMALPSMAIMRRLFPRTEATRRRTGEDEAGSAEEYWKPRPIGLLDIGASLAVAFAIAAVSAKASQRFGADGMPGFVRATIGQQYLVLTTLSVLVPTLFPRFAQRIAGSEELGTFLIFVFFVVIGLPASFALVIGKAPVMLLFCAIILLCNGVVTLALGKLFGYELEELVLAGVVTSGGPMNGVAIAISKSWRALIVPALLTGVWGYVIGNYIGYLMGLALAALFGG